MESISFNSEETRKMFRSIFHNSLDAVLITYPTSDGDKIFYSNTAAENLFGFSHDEFCKTGWESVLYSKDPKLRKFLNALKENGTSKEELVFIKKDGSKFPGEITANLIVENDKNMNIARVKDVSWRKTAEDILMQNQKKFKYQAKLLNEVNDAVLGVDKHFRINYWNHAAEEIFGFQEFEVIGKLPFEIVKPDLSQDETQKIQDELESKGSSQTILKTQNKQGNEIVVEQNFTKISSQTNENEGYMAVYHDITDKQLALNKLKTNEERYRTIMNNIQDGFFRINTDAIIIMASPSMARICGFQSIHEILGLNFTDIYKDIDDPDFLIKEIKENGKLENYELMGIRNDGTTMWVSLNAQFIYDNQNQIQGVDGFIRDISLKKSTEEALKTSEKQYSNILENIQDAYLRADNDGNIILANVAASKLYGHESPEAMIGTKATSYYKNPEERYLVLNILRKYGKIENNEIECARVDGSTFIASQNAQYVQNEQNEIIGTESLIRDVTSAKEAELLNKALLQKEKKLTKELQMSNNELKLMAAELSHANNVLKNLTQDLTNTNQELNLNQKILRRINRSLSESKELFLKAFHSNPAGMTLIDKDGRWMDVNQSFVDLTGYTRRELVGSTSSELGIIKKNMRRDYLGKSQRNGGPRNIEIEVHCKDGTKKTVISSTEAIQVGEKVMFISFIYDITERKNSELQIKKNQKLLRSINQLFHESLTLESEKGIINKFLENAEILTESENGFFGEHDEKGTLNNIVMNHPNSKGEPSKSMNMLKNMSMDGYWGETVKHGLSQIVNNTPSKHSTNLPSKHPEIGSFLGVPFKHGEKTIGMIGLANKRDGYTREDQRNIESLSRAFLEILLRKRAEIQMNQTLKKLEKSNKELEQFAYITSHDLREPLRMITSFLQLLQRRYADKLDKDANEFIGFAVEGAKRLDNMTNDLLLYSRLNSKKRHITRTNLEDALKIALLNLKVPIEETKARVTNDPLPTVEADEKLNVQLFQNLIGNAIKYRGSEPPAIHISVKREKNRYLFSVSDNGIGINPEHLNKIFTIFQRLHTHEEYEGTGIGLAISKKIVEDQGGKIWAESQPGNGTTFYFTIPVIKKDLT
jgi:PAS domain S-box-containing protein